MAGDEVGLEPADAYYRLIEAVLTSWAAGCLTMDVDSHPANLGCKFEEAVTVAGGRPMTWS